MALFIEITEGPDTGSRHLIKEGTRIGRSKGEILIKDVKVSGLHAQIEKDQKGQLILVDRDSVNGLRINGKRVPKIAMMPGVKFQLGKTYFLVVELFGDYAEIEERSKTDVSGWKATLNNHFSHVRTINSPANPDLKAFKQPLSLKFIEGVQIDQEFILGYGPRQVGTDVLDIELFEPQAPGLCFEIIPDDFGPRIKTHDERVLLNDLPVSSEILSEGDKIRIGLTLILVSFHK